MSGSANTDADRYGGPLAGAAPRQHAGHPLPGLEAGAADHRAGYVDTEGERRLGPHLVLALAQQQVRERDPHGVHVDQHLVLAGHGFVDIADDDVGRTGGRDDLGGAHVPIMPRSLPVVVSRLACSHLNQPKLAG